MSASDKNKKREEKLRSALRDNLKKRKKQARALGAENEEKVVNLRERDIAPKKPE